MKEATTNYRFFVKPLRRITDEAIAKHLNTLGEASISAEVQKIIVGEEIVEGVYQLPHRMLTDLRRSEHHNFVRVYVQEGEGEIRPYFLFKKLTQRLRATKAVKTLRTAMFKR